MRKVLLAWCMAQAIVFLVLYHTAHWQSGQRLSSVELFFCSLANQRWGTRAAAARGWYRARRHSRSDTSRPGPQARQPDRQRHLRRTGRATGRAAFASSARAPAVVRSHSAGRAERALARERAGCSRARRGARPAAASGAQCTRAIERPTRCREAATWRPRWPRCCRHLRASRQKYPPRRAGRAAPGAPS
eukprot:scaffold26045_cov124-Isochrysis_galbana.AAC.2